MDELKVLWTRTALKQRDSIFDYWNKRNGSNAFSNKLNSAIKERINILKNQPLSGNDTEIQNVRMVAMRHYSIFYSVRENKIYIVSFWDNRQNPESLLSLLKK